MFTFEEFENLVASASVIPVIDTMPADLFTPLAVYLKLAKAGEPSFLLESVEGGETLARYSFIGTAPEQMVTGDDQRTEVKTNGETVSIELPIIEYLRGHFSKFKLAAVDGLPGFVGGAIGTFGFASSTFFEPKLKAAVKKASSPVELMFCNDIVAFDHAKQLIQIISLCFVGDGENEAASLKAVYDKAVDKISAIRHRLENDPLTIPANSNEPIGEVVSNFEKNKFIEAVNTVKEYIAAGDAYQVVLSQRFEKPTNASSVAVYRAIRSLNPSPYMFLLELPGRSVVGASPEMLVRCTGSKLEYRPIAGTRPRGRSKEEDDQLALEMKADKKEVAEHLMLVDLGRNDLGRVATYGSVKVDGLMSVEKYSHVQHLVTYLTAELRPELDRFDALAACFPAGTVSGAPKVSAIEIISELEPTPRDIYSGAVGYFDYSGNMDTCIAIRTMVLENGVASIQAGAGIVADSNPESEFQETINKASALLRALEMAEEKKL